MTGDELDQKRRDANLRGRIKMLFAENDIVKKDAQDALKEAWSFDDNCFDLQEVALNPQSAALSAMRRDAIKEVITWLTKI